MGVFAYRYGVLTADRSVSDSAASAATKVSKLNGELLAADGAEADVAAFLAGDFDYRFGPDFEGVRVKPGPQFLLFYGGAFMRTRGYAVSLGLRDAFTAGGRDGPYALGAMHHGANAVEAGQAALRCSPTGRGPVDKVSFGDPNA